MATACMHDGSAVSAVLQDDNVIGKQKVKTSKTVLACRECVSACVRGEHGGKFAGQQLADTVSDKKHVTWVRNYLRRILSGLVAVIQAFTAFIRSICMDFN